MLPIGTTSRRIVFYETGYDTFTLRQASRRSWRIGQKHPCRVFYLYYRDSMQARAMALMAQKLDASLALEGQFSAEGLAALSADSGSMTMELAKSLVENIDFGDAERVWAKLNMDEAVAVVQAATTIESPSPLVRDAGRRPRRMPAGSLSAAVTRQLSLFLDS